MVVHNEILCTLMVFLWAYLFVCFVLFCFFHIIGVEPFAYFGLFPLTASYCLILCVYIC